MAHLPKKPTPRAGGRERGPVREETCPSQARTTRFTFDAIGTHWRIDTDEPLSASLRTQILERTQRFDATYSRFRPDSLVSRIAAAPDGSAFDFPQDSVDLFDLYDRLHAATDGAVDPLVGRDLELLGYDPTYSLVPASDSARRAEHVRGRVSWAADVVRRGTTLVTRRPLVIDIGAAGKGYLVDLLSDVLRDAGHTGFVVDGSGDLFHAGGRAIRVGLEHPYDPKQVIGVAHLHGQALCASGVTRRTWGEGLHHVLDARTGVPVDKVVATWVVAEGTALADGLATALFFTEAQSLAEYFRFTYVRMYSDGRAEYSPDFVGEIFT
ncbi:FAD:protein FMN transferase [Streptomyces olivaceus]|uniref:FAD:protein FMN transferase n=1 Tax=Streptomyces olivaceus TaxID=47716 RepID=UPI0040578233